MCIVNKIKNKEERHSMELQKKDQKYLINKKISLQMLLIKNKLSTKDKQKLFKYMNYLRKIIRKVRQMQKNIENKEFKY